MLGVCPADNRASNGVYFIHIAAPPLSKDTAHIKQNMEVFYLYGGFLPIFITNWLPLRQVESQEFYRNLEDFD